MVFGAVITTLAGGESSKLFSFLGAGTQTDYFTIPLDANITSASMSLTGSADFDTNYYFDVNGQAQFNAGTYSNTDYNTLDANGFVYLTSGSTSGDYNSIIFDTNTFADFNSLHWDYKKYNCPVGMAFIPKLGGFCIDQYEASHSDASFCDNASAWTGTCENNYGTSSIPASVAGRIPWATITQTAAITACTEAGKHLCSSAEWMAAANINGQVYDLDDAFIDSTCNVDATNNCLNHSETSGEACNTGSFSDCKSAEGVYDLIGNVQEWNSDVVDVNINSMNGSWQYPNDDTPSKLWGNSEKSEHYGNDGVYTSATKTGRAVIRGGTWPDGSLAGLFDIYLSAAPGGSNSYIGFRCCSTS